MTTARVPVRFDVAIATLDLATHHHVLEFGCGNGALAARIADLVGPGQVTAIDRSATAIARAVTTAPAVRFRHADLASFTSEHAFDRVVGVNVNLFWTGACDEECAVLRSVLAPGGLVVLVYETPGPVRPEIVERSAGALGAAGFATEVVDGPDPTIVAIRACQASAANQAFQRGSSRATRASRSSP